MRSVGDMLDIEAARWFATSALMARLTRTLPEKRPKLQQRIAAVKAGSLDTAPEVQSALLAVQHTRENGRNRPFSLPPDGWRSG